ncbi:MAG: DUF1801 domain-containing protein [Tannerella sp.]|jgi:hypothetical protein|nr:DUF1801 domain-containing protein [Tannerella sp.]
MDNKSFPTLNSYYEKQEAMIRECLLALKDIILSVDDNITHVRKYQIPFFCYKEFNLGFLWVRRKKIIVGFIEDKKLCQPTSGKRRDKIVMMMEINPLEDIAVSIIKQNMRKMMGKIM